MADSQNPAQLPSLIYHLTPSVDSKNFLIWRFSCTGYVISDDLVATSIRRKLLAHIHPLLRHVQNQDNVVTPSHEQSKICVESGSKLQEYLRPCSVFRKFHLKLKSVSGTHPYERSRECYFRVIGTIA